MERTSYEIIPSPLYGWNFKNSESRNVIRYSHGKKELVEYAIAYCGTHRSELTVYNCFFEKEKVLCFETNKLSANKEEVFL